MGDPSAGWHFDPEIPALFHGSALRSTVNGDLVRDVTLTPGAYGADYGRALGFVFDADFDGVVHAFIEDNAALAR